MSKPAKAKRPSVADLVADKAHGSKGVQQDQALIASLTAEVERLRKARTPKPIKVRKGKAAKHIVRVVIPDTHGSHIDPVARAVFLADLAQLQPQEIVHLGDHTDCGGTFSRHGIVYTNEITESYDADTEATNAFFDESQLAAPNATWDVIEGNHDFRIEAWAVNHFRHRRDVELVTRMLAPEGILRMKQRGFRHIKRSEFYDGLAIPGTIRKGRCFFVHGISHSKHADSTHLERFGASVVFGHTHRAMSVIGRTVTSQGHGAWCPGTLAKLQPLYAHTNPTSWSHGYAVQLVNQSTGTFLHLNVPIVDGASMLREVTALGGSR